MTMNLLLYLSQQVTIQGTVAVALPAGIIADYGGAVAPSGWLLCDGAAVSRTAQAALFAVLGTAFGAGDGSTTFNVPDCRGRSPVGAGQGSFLTNRVLAATGGEESHTLGNAELPTTTFPITAVDTVTATGPSGAWDGASMLGGVNGGNNTLDPSPSNFGGNGAHNTMHPFINLTKIISTGL